MPLAGVIKEDRAWEELREKKNRKREIKEDTVSQEGARREGGDS